jgi:hypothetical protein
LTSRGWPCGGAYRGAPRVACCETGFGCATQGADRRAPVQSPNRAAGGSSSKNFPQRACDGAADGGPRAENPRISGPPGATNGVNQGRRSAFFVRMDARRVNLGRRDGTLNTRDRPRKVVERFPCGRRVRCARFARWTRRFLRTGGSESWHVYSLIVCPYRGVFHESGELRRWSA